MRAKEWVRLCDQLMGETKHFTGLRMTVNGDTFETMLGELAKLLVNAVEIQMLVVGGTVHRIQSITNYSLATISRI